MSEFYKGMSGFNRVGSNLVHESAIINQNVYLGENNVFLPFCSIGFNGFIRDSKDFYGSIEIGNSNVFGQNTCVMVGEYGVTKIGNNNLIMNFVNIGHNTTIGDNCEIGVGSKIAGHVTIQDDVKIKMSCAIRNRVLITQGQIIGMGAVVVSDIDKNFGVPVTGNPAKQ
jgi:UDP-N-acetylglucosamine acyltransferase